MLLSSGLVLLVTVVFPIACGEGQEEINAIPLAHLRNRSDASNPRQQKRQLQTSRPVINRVLVYGDSFVDGECGSDCREPIAPLLETYLENDENLAAKGGIDAVTTSVNLGQTKVSTMVDQLQSDQIGLVQYIKRSGPQVVVLWAGYFDIVSTVSNVYRQVVSNLESLAEAALAERDVRYVVIVGIPITPEGYRNEDRQPLWISLANDDLSEYADSKKRVLFVDLPSNIGVTTPSPSVFPSVSLSPSLSTIPTVEEDSPSISVVPSISSIPSASSHPSEVTNSLLPSFVPSSLPTRIPSGMPTATPTITPIDFEGTRFSDEGYRTLVNTVIGPSVSALLLEELRVFCYGDSISRGFGANGFAYAIPLGEALTGSPFDLNLLSDFFGKNQMRSSQARTATIFSPNTDERSLILNLDQAGGGDPFDLIIILLGTNDLLDRQGSASGISGNIQVIHDAAFDEDARFTISLEIPGGQSYIENTESEQKRLDIGLLQSSLSNTRITWVPFPFEFELGGRLWADDIHPSRAGYRNMGSYLADFVFQILTQHRRIFCYGDDFITGRTSDTSTVTSFCNELETALLGNSGTGFDVVVSHVGVQGASSSELLALEASSDPLSMSELLSNAFPVMDIVIILVGAYDIVNNDESADVIASNIIALHEKALNEQGAMNTIMIGVPPSSTSLSDLDGRGEKLEAVNAALESWAMMEASTSFVPFPFDYASTSSLWSSDGVLASNEGYEELARVLTPLTALTLDPTFPTAEPSVTPSFEPTVTPPTAAPTTSPSGFPSLSRLPSSFPSSEPSFDPSLGPSVVPSFDPSLGPSVVPSFDPSLEPSVVPSFGPSLEPSVMPSFGPSVTPSFQPSLSPSEFPSDVPSTLPTQEKVDCPWFLFFLCWIFALFDFTLSD